MYTIIESKNNLQKTNIFLGTEPSSDLTTEPPRSGGHRQRRWRGGSRWDNWRRQSSCRSGIRQTGGPHIDPRGPDSGRKAAAGSPAAAAAGWQFLSDNAENVTMLQMFSKFSYPLLTITFKIFVVWL
jgi:hypothetical protein